MTGTDLTRVLSQQLLSALRRVGEERPLEGDKPLELTDPSCVWLVLEGQADLFSIRFENGSAVGPRHHLCSVKAGQLLFARPVIEDGNDLGLIAVGHPGSGVLRVPLRELDSLVRAGDLATEVTVLVDVWVEELSRVLATRVRPRRRMELVPGETIEVPGGTPVSSAEGVVWLFSEQEELRFVDRMLGEEGQPVGAVPLTPWTWAIQRIDLDIEGHSSAEVFSDGFAGNEALERFHELLISVLREQNRRRKAKRADRLGQAVEADRSRVSETLLRLAKLEAGSVQLDSGPAKGEPPLLAAVRTVATSMGVRLPQVSWRKVQEQGGDPLEILLAAGRIRRRQVILKGAWWESDHGPLLAYREYGRDQEPIALLPQAVGGYVLVEPSSGDRLPVTEGLASTIKPLAFQLYRPLPTETPTPLELLKFAVQGVNYDIGFVLVVGLFTGLMGLVTPLVTGQLFDSVIPSSERGMLAQLILAMLAIAFGQTLFGLTRSIALLRVETRMNSSMQSAMWDRLLSLPLPFFRDYTAGDLASRAQGVDQIRRVLAGVVIGAVLSGIFSIWNVGLLFYYDRKLAGIAMLLVVVAAGVAVGSTALQLRYQRKLMESHGKIAGLLLQLLTGISKLRATGTEQRGFSVWGNLFAEKRETEYRAGEVENNFAVFHSIFPLVGMMVIFWVVGGPESKLSLGAFLAFSAAFGAFMEASLNLVSALLSAVQVVPLWERARPILEQTPEIVDDGVAPGELSGRVEVSSVDFRYSKEGPLVLSGVHLEIEPGEFVAVVGPSGSGKSTLFRLMLGFEQPLSGGVFYDGQALTRLDIRAVRRQFGVVLQTSQVMGGDLFTNIVGNSQLTLEDAWAAAEAAALADDIAAMPMGMHTMVSEGGGTLSGGQRQRLLIARALAHSPRVLFFDEATSALDNKTQAVVSESLERLQVTRVVVAHRLSTIRNADRILVMDRGQLVEQGNYAELMELDGVFAALARRQVA